MKSHVVFLIIESPSMHHSESKFCYFVAFPSSWSLKFYMSHSQWRKKVLIPHEVFLWLKLWSNVYQYHVISTCTEEWEMEFFYLCIKKRGSEQQDWSKRDSKHSLGMIYISFKSSMTLNLTVRGFNRSEVLRPGFWFQIHQLLDKHILEWVTK